MDRAKNDVSCKPVWHLGSVARWLAGPYVDDLERIVTGPAAETAFVGRSWVHQHAILAVLDHRESNAYGHRLLSDFLTLKPKEFMDTWLPLRPSGLARVFHRLAQHRPQNREIYRALIEVLNDGGAGARILLTGDAIDFDLIERLHQLPEWMRALNQDDLTRSSRWWIRQAAALGRLCDVIGVSSRPDILLAVQRSSHGCLSGISRIIGSTDFAQPPWAGNENIRPITDLATLKSIADEFDNCVLGRADDYVSGSRVLYVWRNGRPALAEATRVSASYWICTEILGPKNKPVPIGLERQIMDELAFLTLTATP